MQREILFKAKRKDNQEWVYGYYVKVTEHYTLNASFNKTLGDYIVTKENEMIYVISETVCQYIVPINDIDLYENDIVHGFEDMYDNEVQGKVVLNPENGLQLHCRDNIYHFDYIYDFKVIGNIFDEKMK